MAEATKTETEDLQAQLKLLGDDVAGLKDILRDLAKNSAQQVSADAKARADEAQKYLLDLADKTKGAAKSEIDSLEKTIANKPLQATFIALLAGLLIGRLTRR
ncbi:DUF883 family protein [Albibacillus kandeliae]|uniref:DUF883 family protein n=1 Tax=Albibacillus kandeliae TaxID=2174228 RepID=UPI000D68E519|nr:hypothetical protein [Albibacillus kandeliae]